MKADHVVVEPQLMCRRICFLAKRGLVVWPSGLRWLPNAMALLSGNQGLGNNSANALTDNLNRKRDLSGSLRYQAHLHCRGEMGADKFRILLFPFEQAREGGHSIIAGLNA
jgi:hypothetical protein